MKSAVLTPTRWVVQCPHCNTAQEADYEIYIEDNKRHHDGSGIRNCDECGQEFLVLPPDLEFESRVEAREPHDDFSASDALNAAMTYDLDTVLIIGESNGELAVTGSTCVIGEHRRLTARFKKEIHGDPDQYADDGCATVAPDGSRLSILGELQVSEMPVAHRRVRTLGAGLSDTDG